MDRFVFQDEIAIEMLRGKRGNRSPPPFMALEARSSSAIAGFFLHVLPMTEVESFPILRAFLTII
jgi:hypothetical protein